MPEAFIPTVVVLGGSLILSGAPAISVLIDDRPVPFVNARSTMPLRGGGGFDLGRPPVMPVAPPPAEVHEGVIAWVPTELREGRSTVEVIREGGSLVFDVDVVATELMLRTYCWPSGWSELHWQQPSARLMWLEDGTNTLVFDRTRNPPRHTVVRGVSDEGATSAPFDHRRCSSGPRPEWLNVDDYALWTDDGQSLWVNPP